MMALAVVVLHAKGLIFRGSREITTNTKQDGILLQHRAAFVDEHRLRLKILATHGGQDVVLHMDAERRQVGNLIKLAVVTLTGMAVELQFGNITIRACTAYITDITKAATDIDIGPCWHSNAGFGTDERQRHGIHEVRTVGTLEETE